MVGTTNACVTFSLGHQLEPALASNCGMTMSLRPVQMLVIIAVVPAMW